MTKGRTKYSKVSSEDGIIMRVVEKDAPVRIRSGPGIDFSHVDGRYLGKGTFEIDRFEDGPGSKAGWGHLANGSGWVALDYVDRID